MNQFLMIGITVIFAMCHRPYFPSPPNCSASCQRILFSSDSNLPIFAGFNSEKNRWFFLDSDQIQSNSKMHPQLLGLWWQRFWWQLWDIDYSFSSLSLDLWLHWYWWQVDVGDLKTVTICGFWWPNFDVGDIFWMLVPDANVKR